MISLVTAKKTAQRRPAYLRSLKGYLLGQFAKGREHTPLSEITTEMIEAWFAGRSEKPSSMASNLGRLRALFAFALRRRWIQHNPCDGIEPVRLDLRPPRILTPDEASSVLRFTRERHPRMLACVTLALLAGVRPEECDRLEWSAVNLERGIVTVDAAASKVRRRRIVHLMPAALAWMKLAHELQGRLPTSEGGRRFLIRKLRHLLRLKAWPQDLLRHTAASYWLAEIQDAGKVAHELGNSAGILLRHYRELVSREDAARFWAISP